MRHQYLAILALATSMPALAQQPPDDANVHPEIDAMAMSEPTNQIPTTSTAVVTLPPIMTTNDADEQFDLLVRKLTVIPDKISETNPEYILTANKAFAKIGTNLVDFRVFFDLIYATELEKFSVDFLHEKYGNEIYQDLIDKNKSKQTESEKFINNILIRDAAYYLNFATLIIQSEFTQYNFRYKYSEIQNRKAFELMRYFSNNESGKKLIKSENFLMYLIDCAHTKTPLNYCPELEKSESIKKLTALPHFDVFSIYLKAAAGQTIRTMITRFNGGINREDFLSKEKLKGTGLESPYPDLPIEINNDQ